MLHRKKRQRGLQSNTNSNNNNDNIYKAHISILKDAQGAYRIIFKLKTITQKTKHIIRSKLN